MTCLIKDYVVVATGIIAICLGCLMNMYWEDGYKSLVYKRLTLTNTSKTYGPWEKSKNPFLIRFYFFNWTNPSDLRDPDYKPIFQEVGPYSFWEKTEKVNITFNKNGTVSYRRLRTFIFDEKESVGKLSDQITTINVVTVSAARKSKSWSDFLKYSSRLIFMTQKITTTATVGEHLYHGYKHPVISIGRSFPGLSQSIPFDKFGWFYEKNGSYTNDGLFNIETGANGIDVFGKVRTWNGKEETGFFPGQCGKVRGSGGDFFPREDKESVTIFTPDLCRYLTFRFTKEVQVNKVMGYKYEVGSDLVDNGTENSANKCFCVGECVPSGALNVSTCRQDAPVFVSYPHFYLADQSYLDAVEGLKPDEEKHKIFMTLEPTFGFPLEVAARLQINLLVEPHPDIALFHGVKKIMFPIFWFEQTVAIEVLDETVTFINLVRYILPILGTVTSLILVVIGILCLILISYFKCTRNRKKLIISNMTMKPKEKDDAANYGLINSAQKSNEKSEINANGETLLTNSTPL